MSKDNWEDIGWTVHHDEMGYEVLKMTKKFMERVAINLEYMNNMNKEEEKE